jgi:hypothetical protein
LKPDLQLGHVTETACWLEFLLFFGDLIMGSVVVKLYWVMTDIAYFGDVVKLVVAFVLYYWFPFTVFL